MSAFSDLVRRDLLVAWKEGGTVGVALGFYLVVVTLLPLGIGPDLNLLTRIAPGVLWVALLLAALLSLGRMFETDLEDGSLEVLATGPLPLEAVAAAKSLAHWLTTGVPLTLLAPLLGLFLNLQPEAYGTLTLSMLVGTPARQLARRHRRGPHPAHAARRAAAVPAHAAAVRADAHLRHRGRALGEPGFGGVPAVLPHPVRHLAGVARAGPPRRRRRTPVPAAVASSRRRRRLPWNNAGCERIPRRKRHSRGGGNPGHAARGPLDTGVPTQQLRRVASAQLLARHTASTGPSRRRDLGSRLRGNDGRG